MGTHYTFEIIKLTRLNIGMALIPFFVLGSLFAVVTGTSFDLTPFLWGLIILLCIEIAASFANDYFDYNADKHNNQFGFSGGSGVLIAHPELLPSAKWASLILFSLALVLTVLFVSLFSLPVWVIGYIGVAIFFCWFYSAPPFKLVYRGLGELPHFLAGLMLPGWGYLILTKTLDVSIVLFAIPLGIYGLTTILSFEIPDKEADIHGGKNNLVVAKGRRFTFLVLLGLFLGANIYYGALAYLDWMNDIVNFWYILLLSFIPTLVAVYSVVIHPVKREDATRYAIKNAVALLLVPLSLSVYITTVIVS